MEVKKYGTGSIMINNEDEYIGVVPDEKLGCFWSVSDAARAMGCCRKTIHKRINQGWRINQKGQWVKDK